MDKEHVIINKILSEGGSISWKDKYFLNLDNKTYNKTFFIITCSSIITKNKFLKLYKSENLSDSLEYLDSLIDLDAANE